MFCSGGWRREQTTELMWCLDISHKWQKVLKWNYYSLIVYMMMSVNSLLLLYYIYLCITLETLVIWLGLFLNFGQKFLRGWGRGRGGCNKNFLARIFLKKLVAGVGVYSGLESKKVCETYRRSSYIFLILPVCDKRPQKVIPSIKYLNIYENWHWNFEQSCHLLTHFHRVVKCYFEQGKGRDITILSQNRRQFEIYSINWDLAESKSYFELFCKGEIH